MIFLFLLFGGCSIQEDNPSQYLHFDSASFMMANQEKPPENKVESWHQVELPDLWDIQRPSIGGTGWYRFEIKLNVPPNRLWGIYLPRINRHAAVFLNGVLIGTDAPIEDTNSTSWNHPLYFTIPNGLLISGENLLYIRLESARHNRGRLLPFYIGADQFLRPMYERNYFFRVTANQLVGAFTLTMGLSIGLIWMIRREPVYGWFSLGSLFWALYTSWFFVKSAPMGLPHWTALTNSSGVWMIGCMWIFVCTYMGLKFKSAQRTILIYCLSVTIILWESPQRFLFDILTLAYFIFFIFLGWMLYHIFKYWMIQWEKMDAVILVFSVVPIVFLGSVDWLNLAFHLQYPYMLQYSAPLIFSLIGWALLRRFTKAIDQADTLNRELEHKVNEREVELRHAMEAINRLEKQKILKDERERIMRDIHDGVGGQLVSALAMMEHHKSDKNVTDVLTFALDDLRLIIDSLAPEEDSLPALLTMFKYRYEPKLKEQGVSLNWRQEDHPVLDQFSPQDSLQLLRMIQESFTNILKHAKADQIDVAVAISNMEGDRVSICICDNGTGFHSTTKKKGRGLVNMQRRAHDIGLEIEFFNQTQGACVRIWLTPKVKVAV